MIWFVRHERNPGVPIVPAMKKIDWDKRIQRAVELGERYPSAAEILGFYRHILEFQKTLYADVTSVSPSSAGVKAAFRERLDLDIAVQQLPALLSLVQRQGPSKLAQEAAKSGTGKLHPSSQLLAPALTVLSAGREKVRLAIVA